MAKPIHEHSSRIGQALSSPTRIRALNLLAQKAWSVKELAEELNESLALTSSHLKSLRACHLVDEEKVGRSVLCRVTSLEVLQLLDSINRVAVTLLPEMRELVLRSQDDPYLLQSVSLQDFYRELLADAFLLVDLRPRDEYEAGHIPRSVNLPARELESLEFKRLGNGRPVVAYCRGPWCSMAMQGVQKLNDSKVTTSRLGSGIIEWQAQNLPLSMGTGN